MTLLIVITSNYLYANLNELIIRIITSIITHYLINIFMINMSPPMRDSGRLMDYQKIVGGTVKLSALSARRHEYDDSDSTFET